MSSQPSLELHGSSAETLVEEAAIEPAPDRERRAAVLADYGFADDGALGATIYAARVLIRRGQLRMARQRLEATLKVAQGLLDKALLPLAKALCDRQDDRALNELAPLFEAVEAARRTARDKDTVREQLRSSTASVQRDLEDSRANSEAAASRIRARESELAGEENQLRTQLKRAQALTQRCDIELRALQTAATPPDPQKVEAIQQQRQAREAEARVISDKLTALLGELGETRRSLASARGVMSDLDGKRREQESKHQKVDQRHAKHAAKAHSQLDSALIDLGSIALDKNLVDVTTPEGSAVARARSRVEELRHEVDDHVAADAAFDVEAYAMGTRVLMGVAATVVVLVVLAIR